MRNILLTLLGGAMAVMPAAAEIQPVPSAKTVCAGSLETFDLYSPELQRDVKIDVYLPAGYTPTRSYKVVYMHDGQNLFDASSVWNNTAWEMDEAAQRLGDQAPIIVGIYSEGSSRTGDLMPTEAAALINADVVAEWLGDFCTTPIQGDCYVDFIAQTLKPAIDAHYATLTGADDTSVMGSSMGGLASMYALCRHPEVFGAAGCLSTHFIGSMTDNLIFPTAFAAYLAGHMPLDGKHRIYFDTGDQTLDQYYGAHFRRIMQMLEQMGCTPATLMYKEFPGAAHDERSWASRVDIPLGFLLGAQADPVLSLPQHLYMVGNVNGTNWGTAASQVVDAERDADGAYHYANVTFDNSGTGMSYFSFITKPGANWDTVNQGARYGAASNNLKVTPGSPLTVKYNAAGSEAFAWSIAPGKYDVDVSLVDMTMTVTDSAAAAAVTADEACQPAVRYTLSGVALADSTPYQGIVIEPGKRPTYISTAH